VELFRKMDFVEISVYDFYNMLYDMHFLEILQGLKFYFDSEENLVYILGENIKCVFNSMKISKEYSTFKKEENVFIQRQLLIMPEFDITMFFDDIDKIHPSKIYLISEDKDKNLILKILKKRYFTNFYNSIDLVFENISYANIIEPKANIINNFITYKNKNKKQLKSIVKTDMPTKPYKSKVLRFYQKEKAKHKRNFNQEKPLEEIKEYKNQTESKKIQIIEMFQNVDLEILKEDKKESILEVEALTKGKALYWFKLFVKYAEINPNDACISLINAIFIDDNIYNKIMNKKNLYKIVKKVCPFIIDDNSIVKNDNIKFKWFKIYKNSKKRYDYFWAVKEMEKIFNRLDLKEPVIGVDIPVFIEKLPVESIDTIFEKRVAKEKKLFGKMENMMMEIIRNIEKSNKKKIKKEKLYKKEIIKYINNPKTTIFRFDYFKFLKNPNNPFEKNYIEIKETIIKALTYLSNNSIKELYRLNLFSYLDLTWKYHWFFNEEFYSFYFDSMKNFIKYFNFKSYKLRYFIISQIKNMDISSKYKKDILLFLDLLEKKLNKKKNKEFEDILLEIIIVKKRFDLGKSMSWFMKNIKILVENIFKKIKNDLKNINTSIIVDLRDLIMIILNFLNDLSYKEKGDLVSLIVKKIDDLELELDFMSYIIGEILYNLLEYLNEEEITPLSFINYIKRIERWNIMARIKKDIGDLKKEEFVLKL
jgi:hypothetical protein